MQARKTICSKVDHDLNDFILAILDYNTKRMIIKVGMKYYNILLLTLCKKRSNTGSRLFEGQGHRSTS